MIRPIDLLRQGRKKELWLMCCGYIDLSLEQFMVIQKRLLLEQIEVLKSCELGRKVMRGAMPETVEEFREQVPLTTYEDYLPEFEEGWEDVLPEKPALWVHTIGRPGEYNVKRVPHSQRFLFEIEKAAGGMALMASRNSKGDFVAKEHLKTLAAVGSRNYGSGVVGYMMKEALGCDFLPSNKEGMPFQEKTKESFREALYQGIESCGGLSSILVYVGEMFKQGALDLDARFLLSHPKASVRLLRALIKSKLAHRPMLPKDLWSVKAVVGGGTDSAVFGERLEELWGRRPLEMYAGTEGGVYATQTWNYEGMTFIPSINFLEFIPEAEWFKWQLDRSYQPRTVLLDEVKAGENYEIVITNFHGGVMTRYRPGDMVRIISLRDEELNIDIPQMVFEKRADELIILFGFGHLTEKLIGEAIENIGIPYVDWVASKEVIDKKPAVHIYIELKDDYIASEWSVASSIYDELEKLDNVRHFNLHKFAYGDAVNLLGLKPIQVTLLPRGAFYSHMAQQQTEGVLSGHLGPLPRINPSDNVLALLRAPKVEVEAVPVFEVERTVTR